MSGAAEWWSDASTVSQTSKASPLIICLRAHPEDQVFSSSPFSLLTFKSCMLCVHHRLSAMYEYIACQDFSIFTKRLARLNTNNSLFPTQGQTLINFQAHVFSRLLCMHKNCAQVLVRALEEWRGSVNTTSNSISVAISGWRIYVGDERTSKRTLMMMILGDVRSSSSIFAKFRKQVYKYML